MDKEQIKLMREGSKADFRQAQAEYEAARKAAIDAGDQDTVNKLDALMASSNNYSSANPMNNRSQRQYLTQLYKDATLMAQGRDREISPGALGTTANMFNGYSRQENKDNANNVAWNFLVKNQMRGQAASQVQPSKLGDWWTFRWNDGMQWTEGENTLAERINSYKTALSLNLSSLADRMNSGYRIKGLDGLNANEIQDLIGKLNSINPNDANALKQLSYVARRFDKDGSHWKTYFDGLLPQQSEQDKAHAAILNLGYSDYDVNSLPQYLKDLVNKKKLALFKDANGNLKVYNSDYTDYVGDGFADYNDDWTHDTDELRDSMGYHRGLFVDSDGNAYIGNVDDLSEGSTWYDLYNLEKTNRIDSRKGLDQSLNWNNSNSDIDDEFIRQLVDSKYFSGKNFNGTDVSQLFKGLDERIFAVNGNGTNSVFNRDSDGNIKFDTNTKFYTRDENGNIVEKRWEDLKSKYNRNGFSEGKQLGDIYNYASDIQNIQSNIDMNTQDMGGRNFWDAVKDTTGIALLTGQAAAAAGAGTAAGVRLAKNAGKKFLTKKGVGAGLKMALRGSGIGTGIALGLDAIESGIRYGSWDNIAEDKVGFTKNLLNAIGNEDGDLMVELGGIYGGNSQLLSNLKYFENRDEYDALLIQMIDRDKSVKLEQLPKELQDKYYKIKRDYFRRKNNRTPLEKNGGAIVFAEKGTVLNAAGEDITNPSYTNSARQKMQRDINAGEAHAKEALNKGYNNSYQRKASESQMFKGDSQMTTADVMRIGTMAQDVASIVASFVPGAGTGVAAGLGVTSMLTDLGADTIDPAVSAGEVVKNLAFNAGFAALGLVPGAKTTKVVKNLVKWAPKIMTAAAGLGITMDPSTQETFNKLTDRNAKLNREDWRNISHVLSLVAAGTRGVRQDVANYRVKKGIVQGDEVTLKGLVAADGESPVQFSKEKISKVNKALGEIKTSEEGAQQKALDILMKQGEDGLGLTEEQAMRVLSSPTFQKIKGGVGKFRITPEDTVDTAKTYDNIRAMWNKGARDVKNSSKASRWFANAFGGGDYTAEQRAILAGGFDTPENVAKYMSYKGSYNPMIDWQMLRSKSGATKMIGKRNMSNEQVKAPNQPSEDIFPKLTDSEPVAQKVRGNLDALMESGPKKESDVSRYIDVLEKETLKPLRVLTNTTRGEIFQDPEVNVGPMMQKLVMAEAHLMKAKNMQGLSAKQRRQISAELNQVRANLEWMKEVNARPDQPFKIDLTGFASKVRENFQRQGERL